MSSDDLINDDFLPLIDVVVRHNGLVKHNINGYNDLINSGLNEIMTNLFSIDRPHANSRDQTAEDRSVSEFRIYVTFNNATIDYPYYTLFTSGVQDKLFPNMARINSMSYSGEFKIDVNVEITAFFKNREPSIKTAEIKQIIIGKFPIMVGSDKCYTSSETPTMKREMQEDPVDVGGYFIIGGREIAINSTENIKYNIPHIHKNIENEYVRLDFISQAGGAFENSSQIRIRMMKSGSITIEFISMKFQQIQLPFYMLFRFMGMTSDEEIMSTIINMSSMDKIDTIIEQYLDTAFHISTKEFQPHMYSIEQTEIITVIADKLVKYIQTSNTDRDIQQKNTVVMENMDLVLLPHIGKSPKDRIKKLRFIGELIRKMLLCHMKIIEPSDRDAFSNKRIHDGGISLAKSIKTHINSSLVIPILSGLKQLLDRDSWSSINENIISTTVSNSSNMKRNEFTQSLEKAIASGKQTITTKQQKITNRVAGVPLERKNQTNVISTLRDIITINSNSNNYTERARQMREVHSSMTGYICVSQSADTGEAVGMKKQLAITATICGSDDSIILRKKIKDEINDMGSSLISLNGEWLGYCDNAQVVAAKYRQLRRKGEILSTITIYWDAINNNVEFWTDSGRLRRPLLIVYNNIQEYDAALKAGKRIEFKQWIKFTRATLNAILRDEITLDDLINDEICEYITCEEHENCYVCPSYEDLVMDKDNICKQYTHCDIPQAILGLSALMSPFGNYTQPARITMSTNHGRQAAGWFSLNYPFRKEKNRFLMFTCQMPLVYTISNAYMMPNSYNVIEAYCSYGGNNQEDSAIVAKSAVDRGLFSGVMYRNEQYSFDPQDISTNPNPSITKNIKPNANYSKLHNGIIKVGSMIRSGDVIIGIVSQITNQRKDDEYQYIDKSIVYKYDEPCFAEDVIVTYGDQHNHIVIVKMRYMRKLVVGDKLSSREGNKAIVAELLSDSDMPFTETGMRPDIIFNMHSFPSRMSNGQLIENDASLLCAADGKFYNGTSFCSIDLETLHKRMEERGFRYNGKERMYNGITGNYFDVAIYIGPITEYRLQKFITDDQQVVGMTCPTDQLTGEPKGGKITGGSGGSLRMGEMEQHCLVSHGAVQFMYEANSIDSNGRTMRVCRRCGYQGIYNKALHIYKCIYCNEMADLCEIETTKSAIVLREHLEAANIRMKYMVNPYSIEKAST